MRARNGGSPCIGAHPVRPRCERPTGESRFARRAPIFAHAKPAEIEGLVARRDEADAVSVAGVAVRAVRPKTIDDAACEMRRSNRTVTREGHLALFLIEIPVGPNELERAFLGRVVHAPIFDALERVVPETVM